MAHAGKIPMPDVTAFSGQPCTSRGPPHRTHENHEASFMMIRFRRTESLRNMAVYRRRSIAMKWETPAAIDLRFGMEITMYIANR
jgi:coenzyme PQQ precursor peptide PqqA